MEAAGCIALSMMPSITSISMTYKKSLLIIVVKNAFVNFDNSSMQWNKLINEVSKDSLQCFFYLFEKNSKNPTNFD